MKFWDEFKAFALKGNVVDLAVGVVIGGAFNKIVSSLVSDIIMPFVGLLTGGINFSGLKFIVRETHTDASGNPVEATTINYGNFIETTIDFLIIALSIFVAIKFINKLRKHRENQEANTPPTPTKEETLLTEIRDILKSEQTDKQQNPLNK